MPAPNPEEDQGLCHVFRQYVQKVESILTMIQETTKQIVVLEGEYVNATSNEIEEAIRNSLSSLLLNGAEKRAELKQLLEALEGDLNQSKIENPDEPETQEKAKMLISIKARLNELILSFQQAELNFKDRSKEKTKRLLKITKTDLSEEKLEEMSENPQILKELMNEQVVGNASIGLQNMVIDINNKYNDIALLEKSIHEIHQAFIDLALLVREQGEMLVNIESNIEEAKDYVEKGEENLKEAKKWYQKSRTVKLSSRNYALFWL